MSSEDEIQRASASLDEAERLLNESLALLDSGGAGVAAAYAATALESLRIFRADAGLTRH